MRAKPFLLPLPRLRGTNVGQRRNAGSESTSDNVDGVSVIKYKVYTFANLIKSNSPLAYWRMGDPIGASVMGDFMNAYDGFYKNDQDSGPIGISGDGDRARAFFGENGYGYVNGIAAPLEDSGAKGVNGRQDDESAEEAGVVYLFTRTGSTWNQQAYIKGSNTEAFDEFGSSVTLDRNGRMLAVSARGEDSAARGLNGGEADNTASEAGAAYVFTIS